MLKFLFLSFDDFGHVNVDLNEIIMRPRQDVKSVTNIGSGSSRRIDDKEMRIFLSDLSKNNVLLSLKLLGVSSHIILQVNTTHKPHILISFDTI